MGLQNVVVANDLTNRFWNKRNILLFPNVKKLEVIQTDFSKAFHKINFYLLLKKN